jgi:hypothetical protein
MLQAPHGLGMSQRVFACGADRHLDPIILPHFHRRFGKGLVSTKVGQDPLQRPRVAAVLDLGLLSKWSHLNTASSFTQTLL